MTDDLVDFLKARLGDDERTARAATENAPTPWQTGLGEDDWTRDRMLFGGRGEPLWENEGSQGLSLPEGVAPHIARHDPARVLREVVAKRAIVEPHVDVHRCEWGDYAGGDVSECTARELRLLASVYADHPGYREEWKP